MSVELVAHRFLVVNCENSTVWTPISIGDMMVATFGLGSDSWEQCHIASDEELPPFANYKGVVITGSRFNVRDNLPWYSSLKEEIILASKRGSPKVFGGCFGHQFISYALGGSVDFNIRYLLQLTISFSYFLTELYYI